MSTKPTAAQLPTWDTNLTNVGSGITAGHKTDGFINGFVPTAQEMNTLFAFLYLWCKYLSDGAFSGASTFDSTLGVTGLVTATAGVTAGAGAHVTVSAGGLFKHGTVTIVVPLIANYAGTTAPSNSISLVSPNFEIVWFTIPVGKRITAVRVGCVDSATGPTKLQCALYTLGANGGGGTPGTLSAASSGAGTQQTITVTGLTTSVAAANVYGVYVTRNTGTATCTITNVEVDYDQP